MKSKADKVYLPLSGGTITGPITKAAHGTSWITGRVGATIYNTGATGTDSFYAIIGSKTANGAWTVGTFQDDFYFSYGSDTNYSANNNAVVNVSIDKSGLIHGTAQVAKSVSNSLSIQLNGGTATVYNGSAAKSINITPSAIGAATSGHNHNIESLTNFSSRVYDATISRTAKTFLAAPTSAAGTATFRTITQADLPSASYQVTDWNNATTNGFYMGYNASNAPTTSVWYYGIVITHNTNHVRQIVWHFSSDLTNANGGLHYERVRANGTWGSWSNTIPAASLKWATARNVTYNGNSLYTVSGKFDGSADISLEIYPRRCSSTVQNSNNYPWHRIAHVETTGSYQDAGITLYVNGGAQGSGYGIFRVGFRTNASTASAAVEAKWLLRGNGLVESDVYIGYLQGSSKALADIYVKSHGAYDGHAITLISSSDRASAYMKYTLYDSVEVDNTTTTDKKTSKEVYTSINGDGGAAKTLYGSLYTATSYPIDDSVIGRSLKVVDSSNSSNNVTFAPGKEAMAYADYTHLAGWSGRELRLVSKTQFATAGHTHSYLPLSGGFMTGVIKKNGNGGSWIGARDRATIINNSNSDKLSFYPIVSSKSVSGSWDIGTLGDDLYFSYAPDANYTGGKNETVCVKLSTGKYMNITASAVTNSLSIQLNGGTATTYNGSAARSINITPSGIGAAAADHGHNLSTMINNLGVGTSTPEDADYYVCQYAGGGTTTTTYHRRSMSAMWNWIKGHCNSVYAQLTHKRLSDVCTTITDWNAATTNGFYMANNATNAPTTSVWYFGIVISHNTKYLRQILYRFATSSTPVAERKYERVCNNGTWSSWVDTTVADFVTNAEIDKMF